MIGTLSTHPARKRDKRLTQVFRKGKLGTLKSAGSLRDPARKRDKPFGYAHGKLFTYIFRKGKLGSLTFGRGSRDPARKRDKRLTQVFRKG